MGTTYLGILLSLGCDYCRHVGSFWWKSIFRLLSEVKLVAKGQLGTSNTIVFWQDNWGHGSIRDKFPELFSFSTKDNLTIKDFLQAPDMVENFILPLSSQAHQQFQELQGITQSLQITNQVDRWIYPWGNTYLLSKCIRSYKGEPATPILKKLWKNAAILRYKIFFWLLLHDRVNTRNMLQRRTFYLPCYNCALFPMNTDETSQHLFWDCDFAPLLALHLGS